MRRLPLVFAMLAPLAVHAADQPVPVQEEPKHTTVFDNGFVRVIDVQIAPGETTLYHVHVLPSVIVYLTTSTNRSENWPDKAILTRAIAAGQSRYAAYDEKPLSHRVTNTGRELFRVYDIELLSSPPGDESWPELPAGLRQNWAEKRVRSSTLRLLRNESVTLSAAGCAYLLISISGSVRVSIDTRGTAGSDRTLRWSDFVVAATDSRAEVRNFGADPAELVVLEVPHRRN